MEMLLIVLGILCLIVLAVVIVIVVKSRRDEVENYYTAAQNILKEEKLDELLKNPYGDNFASEMSRVRLMIFLKFKNKEKYKYVFDLTNEICIGRDKDINQICVNEPTVSHQHCRIFSNSGVAYIQDLNSANGLVLKRGMARYRLNNGSVMQLVEGDELYIGNTIIKTVVFNYDLSLM